MIILTEEFTAEVRRVVVPLLCGAGFGWRGIRHYRRYVPPFIHCIYLQSRLDGRAMCVNLGVHLDFLPPLGVYVWPVEEMDAVACGIRTRLAPKGKAGCWWPSCRPRKKVATIRKLFLKVGLPWFERYREFPGVLADVRIADMESYEAAKMLPGMTRMRMAVTLAWVHEHLGHPQEAIAFAKYALTWVNRPNKGCGKGMQKPLEDLIRRIQGKPVVRP